MEILLLIHLYITHIYSYYSYLVENVKYNNLVNMF